MLSNIFRRMSRNTAILEKKMNSLSGISKILIPIVTLVAIALGCSLFSGKTSNDEVVFPATEVGVPEGPATTKNIGPEGGSLASPDGRLTLTVPPNALTEKMTFSIQPITNNVDGGLGLAYRLEPSTKTFTTPLKISVRYEEKDLEGTVPEALSLAYQDQKGAWHAQTSPKVDEAARTLSVSTTHFSDWLFLRTVGISPGKANVLVGETVYIKVDSCPDRDPIQKYNIWKYVFGSDCRKVSTDNTKWALVGAGTLTSTDNASGIVYTAPPVRPADPLVRVIIDIDILVRDPDTGEVRTYPRKFESRIKIVGRAYHASGKAGTTVLSGDICDLSEKFSLKTNNPFVPSLEFEPDPISPTKGTLMFTTGSGLSGSCECTYTIIGTDTLKTGIELKGSSTGSLNGITGSGGGSMHVDLVPLDKECKP